MESTNKKMLKEELQKKIKLDKKIDGCGNTSLENEIIEAITNKVNNDYRSVVGAVGEGTKKEIKKEIEKYNLQHKIKLDFEDSQIKVASYCCKARELDMYKCFLDCVECTSILNKVGSTVLARIKGIVQENKEFDGMEYITVIEFSAHLQVPYINNTFDLKNNIQISNVKIIGGHQNTV